MGNPLQSYRASPAIWDHMVLSATLCLNRQTERLAHDLPAHYPGTIYG